MRRIGKWILWTVLGLLALLICLWVVSRMRGPTVVQTEALALMQQRAPLPPGGNAFAAMWLLAYDVPESELQAVTEADVTEFVSNADSAKDAASLFFAVSKAKASFADQAPSTADAQLFCKSRGEDCLDRIRADPAVYDGLMERNQALLERVVALQRYGYYQGPPPAAVLGMSPPFQYGVYDLTRVAWNFARGEVDTALAGACDGAHLWRRMGAHSDSVMARQVSNSYLDGYARLLAQMLGELPRSQKVPPSCDVAFAPPIVADSSICEAMRGEFAMSDHFMNQAGREGAADSMREIAFPNSLFWDVEKTSAINAAGNAWACSQETGIALQGDVRVDPESFEANLWRLECVANLTGCLLAHIAFPAYYDYQWQAQDHAARLESMGALLWLRGNANQDEPLQAQFVRHWEQTRRGDRGIRFTDDGRTLEVQQYARRADGWWSLPFFPEGLSEPVRGQTQ